MQENTSCVGMPAFKSHLNNVAAHRHGSPLRLPPAVAAPLSAITAATTAAAAASVALSALLLPVPVCHTISAK
jgi:hypothetical protein